MSQEPICVTRLCAILAHMSAGVLNLSPWARRSLVARVGYYSPGPRAIGSLSINGRQTIAILSLAARLFSRSICTNTHITLISAQRQQLTSTPLWRPSAGETPISCSKRFRSGMGRNHTTSSDRRLGMRTVLPLLFVGAIISGSATAQEVDWQKVDDALGRKPAVSADVHRYGFPRSDLSVTLDGVTIKPALALGGWVAFKPAHGGVMVMGDLVLLESEINPVMSKLIEGGLDITAVHNHLLRAQPLTFYMHVSGHGDPVKLANALYTALAASKTPLTAPAPAAAAASDPGFDAAELDRIIGG